MHEPTKQDIDMGRSRVLVFKDLPPDQLERLAARHDVVMANPRVPGQEEAFRQALPTVRAAIGASVRFDEPLLDTAPHLTLISSVSVGVDNYPVQALQARGITLCHTPGVLTETVADQYFSLILATSRRIVELARFVQDGNWTHSLTPPMFGWNVHGKTLGILGYGRIGKAVARRAACGFNMRVLYYTRSAAADSAGRIRPAGFDDVLRQSDFVAIVLPLTDQTRGMIGARELARMKPGAILINGARGPIVDEDALLDALDNGTLRAAGLDVFSTEPLPPDSRLRRHPKVVALPHSGSATHETRHAMAEMAVSNLLLALDGQEPLAVFKAT
jgi:gluconate 2-dehydrogenase